LNGQDVGIFPNPTGGSFKISIPVCHEKAVIVEISTLQGEKILRNTFKQEIGINLPGRPKGTYLVKLVAGSTLIVRKVCLD
jgi:hypothetical protein